MNMSLNLTKIRILYGALLSFLLSGCFHPPYNNFKRVHPVPKRVARGAAAGAVVGAVITATLPGALIGTAVGGTVGGLIGLKKSDREGIIQELNKESIQYVQYGDTMTLIVPVDKYFMFESPRLNEICYPGLINIIRLLKFYPLSPVYVAGFTDNVGSDHHKKLLSQAQAETLMTFLWANGIQSELLKAEGYGDKNDVGDNHLIHGSAYNRRIEIQWFGSLGNKVCANCLAPTMSPMYATK